MESVFPCSGEVKLPENGGILGCKYMHGSKVGVALASEQMIDKHEHNIGWQNISQFTSSLLQSTMYIVLK